MTRNIASVILLLSSFISNSAWANELPCRGVMGSWHCRWRGTQHETTWNIRLSDSGRIVLEGVSPVVGKFQESYNPNGSPADLCAGDRTCHGLVAITTCTQKGLRIYKTMNQGSGVAERFELSNDPREMNYIVRIETDDGTPQHEGNVYDCQRL